MEEHGPLDVTPFDCSEGGHAKGEGEGSGPAESAAWRTAVDSTRVPHV
ncbi:unnamed protein product [Ectocarpus sp. 6 AP-2014]